MLNLSFCLFVFIYLYFFGFIFIQTYVFLYCAFLCLLQSGWRRKGRLEIRKAIGRIWKE